LSSKRLVLVGDHHAEKEGDPEAEDEETHHLHRSQEEVLMGKSQMHATTVIRSDI